MKPTVMATGLVFGVWLLLGVSAALWVTVAEGAASESPPRALQADSQSRFADPPSGHRMLQIIHGWPEDPDRQDAVIERVRRQGFGGVVCNVSFDSYLESESHWQAFERAVQQAKAAGWTLWLYDEKGYPSGNAGGLVLRDHPEWEAEGLLVSDVVCGEGVVKLERPPGDLMAAVALPLDSEARTRIEGTRAWLDIPPPGGSLLEWEAPSGRWQVLVVTRSRLYEGTHAEGNLWQKLPYPNLLDPEPTRRFLELTHGRYAEHLGSDLGRWFAATFTDEPSLMSLFLRRMPWRPLPWSSNLSSAFRQRRGYDLEPVVPDLVFADGRPEAIRHRYDYWQTVAELVSDGYFGQIQDWCRGHGLASGGHLLAEERLLEHVPLYGDLFRCLRRLDAPSMDCLTSVPAEVPWHVARLVASAAELDGRPLVMSETSDHSQVWRAPGDARPKRQVSEAEIRGTLNRLLHAGVNVLTSYYSFDGLDDAARRRLNEWVARGALLLRGGHPVADVALVYPAESLWTKFVPARHWAGASTEANRIDHLYRAALDALFESRRDVSIIDSRTLAEARVEPGYLVHGGFRWQVVILPGVDTLPLAAWRNLERFVEGGGMVVALGVTPANSDQEFPCEAVRALAARLFGGFRAEAAVGAYGRGTTAFLPAGTEPLLSMLLHRCLPEELTVTDDEDDSPLRLTHRRVGGQEVYFLINDSPSPWSGRVTAPAAEPGRRWDLATGGVATVEAGESLSLSLEGYGATGLTWPTAGASVRRPLTPGPLRVPALRGLPHGEPQESHGEFVRAVLSREEDAANGGGFRWRAAARLTRSNVDTFLFVRLPVEPVGSFQGAEVLEIESWVPEGQRASTGLLVILHEAGGADYLAELARPLDAPGHVPGYVPVNRFRLAGWSTDDNARLDRDQVQEVRIGWGGYFGSEGETVEFTIRAPRYGVRQPAP